MVALVDDQFGRKGKLIGKVFSLFLLIARAVGRRPRPRGSKIIGGRNARVGEFPYQISLQRKDYFWDGAQHICGGAIIDEHHVLTAAHCLYGQFQAQLRVVAGVLNVTNTLEPTRVSLTLAQVYLHEGFVFETLLNDIALIRVDGGFPLNSPVISAISLQEDHLLPSVMCIVSGWGNTLVNSIHYPHILQALYVPLISQDICVASYVNIAEGGIEPGMFCAGYVKGGKDACLGDSGGPLQCGGLLTGIVSWGNDCALPKYPGVYTEVAYYKDWIKMTLAKSFDDGWENSSFFPE
ncbi:anionic trypsin-2 [Anabrus simplex]|uniref:anionic trypsin-2 n=1 Tax=Anabrus simplex TaxID=316456 RepID=UPI0035A3BC32